MALPCVCVQERAREMAMHEEQLEEWKSRFKAEALRQIGEREKMLADWQQQLDAKRADLDALKKNMEVGGVNASLLCPTPLILGLHLSSARGDRLRVWW